MTLPADRLTIDLQASLQGALGSVRDLRSQQAEEMKEVENYVDHIRKLSDERDGLTLEFEAENDLLKAEVEKLNAELEGMLSGIRFNQ